MNIDGIIETYKLLLLKRSSWYNISNLKNHPDMLDTVISIFLEKESQKHANKTVSWRVWEGVFLVT